MPYDANVVFIHPPIFSSSFLGILKTHSKSFVIYVTDTFIKRFYIIRNQ